MQRHVSGGDTGAWAILASVTGGCARRGAARARGIVSLLARVRVPAVGPLLGRLRVPAVSLLLALTLLVGPGGPLAAGVGIGPDLAHAQPSGDKIRPNRYGATQGSRSVVHLPPRGTSANAPAGRPQPIAHAGDAPFLLGTLALDPAHATSFVDSLGRLEVDAPAGAVTAADAKAAGGGLALRVIQLAPGSGSNAGGTGIVSFGTYLIQVVDARGRLLAPAAMNGRRTALRRPVTLRLRLERAASAVDLTRAFATVNWLRPTTLTTRVAATAAGAADPVAKRPAVIAVRDLHLGPYASLPANTMRDVAPAPGADRRVGHAPVGRAGGAKAVAALVVQLSLPTPSSSISWNTSGAIAFFGKPDIFNADLSAGSLAGGIPIDVPAGPGGLTPPISLAYSSAGVAENHSVQGAAGWVGEGWNLGLGSINWSQHNTSANCKTCAATWESSWQLSDPYGTGAEIIPPNINVATFYDDTPNAYCALGAPACPLVWHTANESYAKIVEYQGPLSLGSGEPHPPCFRVWLKNGIMEEFGCTADALEHYVAKNIATGVTQDYVSGWLLDLITDPQGNQIHLTYTQDIAQDPSTGYHYTRDVVLSTIEWDAPACDSAQTRCTTTWQPLARVDFQAAHAPYRPQPIQNPTSYTSCNTGMNLRCDDPLDLSGSGGLPAPGVQSTFVLNDILVQTRASASAGWNNLRDYMLGYEQGAPHTMSDPVTGKAESAAGALILSQFQEWDGADSLAQPKRTFTYAPVAEYYEDDTWAPNPATVCGLSWNTGYPGAGGCALWSESTTGNDFFLATANNGMGLAQTFSWANARNNTHGVNGGGSNTADPLYCNGKESQGYPCNLADDQDWSHIVLTAESQSTLRVTQSGQGATLTNSVCGASGTVTCTPITSTTAYTYRLTYPLAAQECGDCVAGMYWGNQNEGDYLDYYNGKFMGFAQATVSLPDGAVEQHYFDATAGWGVYDAGQSAISCANSNMYPIRTTCHNAPWWTVTNAGHGHETEVDTYDTDGKHVLSATTTTLAAVCPPSGVAGTPGTSQSRSTYGSFDGELVSELDGDNPVAVCDVQTTRADGYRYDGSCVASVVGGTGPVVAVCGTSGVPHRADLYTHDQYGGVLTDDRQTNGASPWEVVDRTVYTWNDAVSATATSATGTYLIDLPAYTATSDGPDTVRLGCSERGYDGHAYTSGNSNPNLTGGEVTSTTRFTSGCGTSGGGWVPSGPVTTTATYNGYGTPITSDDADANAGNAAHLGCLPGFGTTTYSVCDGVDQTYGALPIWHKDALNQISYTNYDTSGSLGLAGGFGRWPVSTEDFNGQTTTFGYDTLGRMTSETLPGETSGETTESWSYTTWCASLSAANSPCVEVDDSKRYGSGSTDTVTSRAFYDGAGRLAETRSPGPSGQDVVAYADYDAAGHFTFESSSYFVAAYGGAAGPAAYSVPDTTQMGTSTVYDGAERVTSVTDAVGHVTATSYAPAQGLNGDTGYYEATTITDPQGHQRVTLTDAVGRETYDERYTGTAAPYTLYAATKYYYDLLGGLTEILPPNGVGPVTYAYDAAGRKTALSDPDRGNETYMYDADGNLMAASDARGAAGTVYAGYDGLDRLAWRNTTNTSTGAYVTYTYDSTANGNDGVGNLTAEHFAGTPGGPNAGLSGSYAYVYDARGQTTSIAETIGSTTYTAGASYDDAGDLISETYPDGETKSDTYGAQGWLQSVQTRQGSTVTTLLNNLTYGGPAGPYGAVTGASVGNGTYTYSAGYDLLLRPTWTLLTRAWDGATEFYQSRTYDAGSELTALQTDLQGQTDYQAFCYDDQSRLVWATSQTATGPCGAANTAGSLNGAAYTQSFTYDTLDRLTIGPLGAYTYGDGHHVHAATTIGATWTAAYDAAGNLTCRAPTSDTTCTGGSPTGAPLTYDNEGQLIQWQSAPGGSPSAAASYLYDGEGHRVEAHTTQSGTPSTTVYVGGVEEVTTSGTQAATTTYYYAGGQRVALAVNGVFSYLASDQIGTANVALDANGNTTAAALYAPYGTTRYASGGMPGNYGFTGQHADVATGLDYYGARYYDPVAGQFASADTLLDGLDRYEYVGDNPETGIDPTGHFDVQDAWWCVSLCSAIFAVLKAIVGAPTGAAGGQPAQDAFRPEPRSGPPTAQQYEEGYTLSREDPESGDYPGATGGHGDPTNSDTPINRGGGNTQDFGKPSNSKRPPNTGTGRPSGKKYGARGGNKRVNMFQRVNGVDAGDPAGIYVPAPITWRQLQLPTLGNDTPTTSQSGWEEFWSGVGQWASNAGQNVQEWFNQPAPQQEWCACTAPGPGGGDDGEGDPGEPFGGGDFGIEP